MDIGLHLEKYYKNMQKFLSAIQELIISAGSIKVRPAGFVCSKADIDRANYCKPVSEPC
jgi:hypothetical protein